jgi:hypothetical protein
MKDKGGRPSKLTEDVLIAWAEVLEENILFATDEELFLLVNERLHTEDRICYTTFKNWKAGKQEHNELFDQFLSLYKKSLTKEKERLFIELQKDKQAWQRWAWIIERKFDEWNIRNKSEIDHTTKGEKISVLIAPDGKEWKAGE